MVERDKSDEGREETKPRDGSVAQPAAATPQQTAPRTDTGEAKGDPKPSEPILVRLVGNDDLKPFEKQTLELAIENLTISKRTYRIAILGFVTAVAAAVFVAVQVKVMSYQTQIMGSQSESAAAGAAIDEMNTRKQLSVAQQQAMAAQDSVKAIQRQMRQDQRAWMNISIGNVTAIEGQSLHAPVVINNTGKTAAKRFTVDIIVQQVHNVPDYERSMQFSYKGPRVRDTAGFILPNAPIDLVAVSMQGTADKGAAAPPFLSHEDAVKLRDGTDFVVIFAKLTYYDIFGIEHWTKVCNFSIPSGKLAYAKKCTDYNDVDNN